MPKYQTGDVAAFFSQPKPAQSDSGKKLQSLFDNFYSKSNKKHADKSAPKATVANTQIQENIVSSTKKEKKRKHKSTNDAELTSVTSQHEDGKKNKVVYESEDGNFPRKKSKKQKKQLSDSFSVAESTSSTSFADEKESNQLPEKTTVNNKKIKISDESENVDFPRKISKKQKKQFSNSLSTSESKTSRGVPDEIQADAPLMKKSTKMALPESDDLFDETEETFVTSRKQKKRKIQPFSASEFLDCDVEGSLDVSVRKSHLKPVAKKNFDEARNSDGKIVQERKRKNKSLMKDMEEMDESDSDSTESPKKKLSKGENILKKDFIPLRAPRVEETEERMNRTLFVGNLPMETKKKDLVKMFSPFGPVESVRLRGAIPAKQSVPKKIAAIQGKFHQSQHCRHGYVVFVEEKSVFEALSLKGTLVKSHHIVLDRIGQPGKNKTYDEKRSIFVGNLPFGIEDEMLWTSFEHCGEIEAVRVIRDRDTGAGKGFGYVLFRDVDARNKALASTDVEINERTLRIKAVEKNPQKQKNTVKPKPEWSNFKRSAFKERKQGNEKKSLKKIMKNKKRNHQKKVLAKLLTK